MDKKKNQQQASSGEVEKFPGYPHYPEKEDIYNKDKKEEFVDDSVPLSDDLDVPGSELDDNDEIIGEEDEENNYYSLGGDEKNSLEEDEGD